LKKISSKLGVQGIKRSGILQKSRTWQKGKIFYRKTEFLGLENFAKNRFSEKKSLGTS
jgi:hypothetical protein